VDEVHGADPRDDGPRPEGHDPAMGDVETQALEGRDVDISDAGVSTLDTLDTLGADGLDVADGDLRDLMAALDSADDLSVDARLELLRRAEEAIASSLEGLDGL